MNRKLIGLSFAMLFVMAGCQQNESSTSGSTSSTTTTNSTTPSNESSTATNPSGTATSTTSGGMTAGATVVDPAAGPKEVTMPSGLKYVDTVVGAGVTAKNGMTAKVKYAGRLTDGRPFDSGEYEFQIGVSQVIQGWHQGIPGMKVGGKRTLTIPPQLGYGEPGYPGTIIGPNATLIFDIELVDVK